MGLATNESEVNRINRMEPTARTSPSVKGKKEIAKSRASKLYRKIAADSSFSYPLKSSQT